MTEPNVVILVPRREGIEDRDALWAFARKWWEGSHRTWRIVEGHHRFGPFNRSAAINSAAMEAGEWDVAVIIDADVLCEANAIRDAVDIAAATDRMVLGYHERIMLTQLGTMKVMDGYKGNWKNPAYIGKVHLDACSSAVIVSRKLFDLAHGFDERFNGWGWEDVAFRVTCETMSGARMLQVASTCWHLHHTTSHENNRRESTLQANEMRGAAYKAAHWDKDAVLALLNEAAETEQVVELAPTRIPRILHRTVPEHTSPQAEQWWDHFRQLHPGWELMTHRDPMDPDLWPELGDLWAKCANGAQKAGLIRLEALWRWGGVYVDSDVEPYRTLEPLLHLSGFAAWEDHKVVPDAVLGAEPQHPAVALMMLRARDKIESGADAWHSGPGVTTATLPGRHDWTLFPPGAFFPYHYSQKNLRSTDHMTTQPWCFMAHHWEGSWLTKEQRSAITRRAGVRR